MEGSLAVRTHHQGANTLACTEWASHGPPMPVQAPGRLPDKSLTHKDEDA